MSKRIRTLIAVVVAALLGSPAWAGPGPRVVRDEVDLDRCPANMPRCGRLVTVYNPLPRPVTVRLSCGPALLLDLQAVIGGRRRVAFSLSTDRPAGLRRGQCVVRRWGYTR